MSDGLAFILYRRTQIPSRQTRKRRVALLPYTISGPIPYVHIDVYKYCIIIIVPFVNFNHNISLKINLHIQDTDIVILNFTTYSISYLNPSPPIS